MTHRKTYFVQFLSFAFKRCCWRPLPAHPRCADLQRDSWICKIKSFWLIYIDLHFIFIFNFKFLIILSLNQYFTFEGCSWRPIPAHPWYAGWLKNGIVEFASSRAFDWYAEHFQCECQWYQIKVCFIYLKPGCWFIEGKLATTTAIYTLAGNS